MGAATEEGEVLPASAGPPGALGARPTSRSGKNRDAYSGGAREPMALCPAGAKAAAAAAAAGDNGGSRAGKAALVPAGRGALPAHLQPLQVQPVACTLAIHDLDQETIELIFTFLPPADRRSAAAVCRLWRRVHNSSTKLWGSVLLSGERIVAAAAEAASGSAVGAWLAARLEAMRAVRLWSPGAPLESFASSLARLLSHENRVQSFSYVCGDVSVSRLLGELQRLTSLHHLDVLAPWAPAPGQGLVVWAKELAKLKPLRNLLSLQLAAREIRGTLPPGLFRCLNRLQHLTISARCRLPAAVVRQLSGLRSLELHGASLDEAAAQAAAALQQLTRLGISVEAGWLGLQAAGEEGEEAAAAAAAAEAAAPHRSASSSSVDSAGGSQGKAGGSAAARRWQEHAIWGQLPLLGRLQVLVVGADLPAAGSGSSGGGEGASFDAALQAALEGGDDGEGEGGGEADGGGGGGSQPPHPLPAVLPFDCLEGSVPDGIMDCPGLTHLALPVALTHLPDLLPGQLPALRALDLTHSIAEALPPSWCCHAQRLRRLVLNGSLAGGRLPPELGALQGLRHLELRACRLRALPPCVASLGGLTALDLGINALADLPGGPYLRRLRHLVLRSNALRGLPPALAAAGRLQSLDLGENEGLALREGDVEGVLCAMPRLRLLVLSRHPAGFGFGPYMSAASGAAWDSQSVAVLMQLARALPQLAVQLERPGPPGPLPCDADADGGCESDGEGGEDGACVTAAACS